MSDTATLYRGSVSPDEAVHRLCSHVAIPDGDNNVRHAKLAETAGCILAQTVTAPFDLPPTNNAAVDGYAVDSSFLTQNPAHAFPVIGRAAAGHPFDGTVPAGSAVRIFTGGVMPAGTDAVAMHEFCTLHDKAGNDGPVVTLDRPVSAGMNNRPAGENLHFGETIIEAGTRLDAADIGIAAAAGLSHLPVRRPLTVGLLSMGDEIIEAGNRTAPGQIHDSNRPMLAEMLAGDGITVRDFGIVPDRLEALTDIYGKALRECDAVLSSGGASDGDEDHTQAAMQAAGVDPVFWRLAIKPGRPMSAGVRDGRPIMCLPGNPVAAFVCFRLVCAPVLAHMAGATATPVLRLPVKAGFTHTKSAGRAEYLRVRLTDEDGTPVMQLHGRKGAGVLSSLTGADGLVEIPVDNDGVAVGDYLSFIPFRETGL